MLVVWEPILPSDWRPPGGRVLARLPDERARQFWDSNHLVAKALSDFAKQKPNQPQPDCCVQKGFNWDEVILYGPHSQWHDTPTAVFWSGPVVRAVPNLETAFKEQLGPGKSAYR